MPSGNDSQALQSKYMELKRISKLISSDYNKVKNTNFDERSWKTQGAKIKSNIASFQRLYKFLSDAVANDSNNSDTIKKIKDGLETEKKTIGLIQSINDKTRYYNQDTELVPAVEERDEVGQQQNQQIVMDLMNNKEVLENRRKELEDIHQTAALLKDTTDKMAQDVHRQGEMLDNIEDHVLTAKDNAQKAKGEITKADEMSKGNRKRMICFIVIIFVAIAAIAAIVLSVVLK